MTSRSLHFRIVLMLGSALGIVTAGLMAVAWYYAALLAERSRDELLTTGAAQIAENMYVQGGVLTVDPPVAVLSGRSPPDRATYQVVDPRGVVVAGSHDLPPPRHREALAAGPTLRNAQLDGQAVRVATVGRLFASGWASVSLAETLHGRQALTRELTIKALALVLAMSAIAFGTTLLAVRLALAPLGRVERALRARSPNDLRPLLIDAPVEIQALLAAINDFMGRLAGRVGLMRRVIGDAAHQIRTPLAALSAQLDLLSAEPQEARRVQHLARVQQRAAQLNRLANQLLDHAMVVHRADAVAPEQVDLVAVARRALLDSALPDRRVDISIDAPDTPLIVSGDPVTLREALSNLIENAFRHGAPTRLALVVRQESDAVIITVTDDGPGIPPNDWSRVREPFHGRTDDQAGAGLGLSIVAEVVRAHGGALAFSSHSEAGFTVTLRFPRHPQA